MSASLPSCSKDTGYRIALPGSSSKRKRSIYKPLWYYRRAAYRSLSRIAKSPLRHHAAEVIAYIITSSITMKTLGNLRLLQEEELEVFYRRNCGSFYPHFFHKMNRLKSHITESLQTLQQPAISGWAALTDCFPCPQSLCYSLAVSKEVLEMGAGRWASPMTCFFIYIHTYLPTYLPTYLHTYILLHIHAYIHANIHTYIHACIHTYIHTYIHTSIHPYMTTYSLSVFKVAS